MPLVLPVIEARRVEPREDVISICAQAQAKYGPEEFSDQTFLDMLLHLLTGGFETTHLIELLLDYLVDRLDRDSRRRRSGRSVGADAGCRAALHGRQDARLRPRPRHVIKDSGRA